MVFSFIANNSRFNVMQGFFIANENIWVISLDSLAQLGMWVHGLDSCEIINISYEQFMNMPLHLFVNTVVNINGFSAFLSVQEAESAICNLYFYLQSNIVGGKGLVIVVLSDWHGDFDKISCLDFSNLEEQYDIYLKNNTHVLKSGDSYIANYRNRMK